MQILGTSRILVKWTINYWPLGELDDNLRIYHIIFRKTTPLTEHLVMKNCLSHLIPMAPMQNL
jgi:hypothetical protein